MRRLVGVVGRCRLVAAAGLIAALAGCAPRPVAVTHGEPHGPLLPEKTCLVLSVGGAKGLAHIGAIEALESRGEAIDCVYGNSMGSLVGGLYASDPKADLAQRYRGFIAAYRQETESDVGGVGVLVGIGAYLIGGPELATSVASMAGVRRLDLDRLERVLGGYTAGADVASLAVPYGTSYQIASPTTEGMDLVIVKKGPLARAVRSSIANPFLFQGLDVKRDPLDPGADRVAAVPVEDAWRRFKPTRIIAINVTGEPAFYSKRVKARVEEIMIPVCVRDLEKAMMGEGDEFERIRRTGYEQTAAMLARYASGEDVQRGFLGVTTIESEGPGLEVTDVIEDGPSAAAGVRVGDRITFVGANPVTCNGDLLRHAGAMAPGALVAIELVRGAERVTVTATVGEHPQPFLD